MRHYIDQIINGFGVPIAGATVDVRAANASPGTGILATIYSDDGITVKTNPVTTDATGTFDFYVADGRYDLVAKSGTVTKIVGDLEILDSSERSAGDVTHLTNVANITTLTTGGLTDTGNALIGGNLTVTGTTALNGGLTVSQLVLTGATSGTTTLTPLAIASGALTVPSATDTLIGKATTDVLTNKTFDTAGIGNVLKINGTQVSAVTGSGNTVALSHNPTFDATVTLTESAAPASVGGADIIYGDSTAHRLKLSNNNGTYDNITTAASVDTLTHKTFDTAGAGNSLSINGNAVSAVSGTGNTVVLNHNPTLDATLTFTESAAPASVGGADILYGDSLTHRLKLSNNNGVYDNVITPASTDTLTHKTFDTGGAGNSFSIAGTAITAVTGTGSVVLSNGPTIGASGLLLTGSVSGTTTVVASGTASGTLTLPAATDTLVGKNTADTFNNKTIDTASPNTIKIAGTSLTAVTGSGSVVLATSPSLTTPAIGSGGFTVAGATSGTTTIAATSVASGTLTLPATTDTLVGKNTTDTFNNKTIDTASPNTIKIAGTSLTSVTGTNNVVVLNHNPSLDATLTFVESAAPASVGGSDILYGDSTAHRLKLSNNNGTYDNIVTAASTDTFTHKTFDTAGAGNVFDINGTAITAVTGTGSVVLAASPTITGTDNGTETLQNKRLTPRQVSMADAVSVTPTSDTADINTFTSTQVSGTLTVNAPTGTPTDGQKLVLRLKSTNAQTYSFNATYAFSTTVTAPTTLAAGKTDYIGCMWNATNTKWDVVAVDQGH